MKMRQLTVGASLLLFGAAGCADLDVANVNRPDTREVLASPADVEALIADAFHTWWDAVTWESHMTLSTASFQHGATPANFGMVEFSWMPERRRIDNISAFAFASTLEYTWNGLYAANSAASDGLAQIAGGLEIGAGGARNSRAMAWGKFVQGLAHAEIARTYDQGFLVDENVDIAVAVPDAVPYTEVRDFAFQKFQEAIDIAQNQGFSAAIPGEWFANVGLTADEFVRVVRSYRARYRATIARDAAERAAVDWNAVIADVDNGIEETVPFFMDREPWTNWSLVYMTFPGWSAAAYPIFGMADQSGGYQAWRDKAWWDFTEADMWNIITPDQRFPQGATTADQQATPGTHICWDDSNVGSRPERGPWRWSNYRYCAFDDHTFGGYVGVTPDMNITEMHMLKAEGLLRQGQDGAAADLINISRTAAGLNATDAGGTNTSCVPKLPDGTCGDLWEMMKWEKRMETVFQGHGSWFFDMRGWEDLPEGTPVQYPIPASELETLQLPLYTFGGGSDPSDAPGTATYGW